MIIIDEKNFDSEVTDVVLVDFYADWCGPCRMLAPILEEVSKQIDVEIKKVNVDKSEELARRYGVMSIPTLILFKDGKEVKRHTGLLNLEEIKEFVNI